VTPKQKLVLDFIQTYIKVRGFAPTYKDIALGTGTTSASNIHRMVHALKNEGLLDLKPKYVRTLKLKDDTVEEMSSL